MNFPVAGWYLSSPPSMVPAHIFPSLSSCRLQIKFPLMLWASPGSLRNTVKVYPSYLFNPSRVPIQIKPFRSCSMQVALLMESPWVVERFLNLKYGCCACAGRGLHAAKAEMISRYLIIVEGWFIRGYQLSIGWWGNGRLIVKTAPWSLLTFISPPCEVIYCFTMARPRPVPLDFFLV